MTEMDLTVRLRADSAGLVGETTAAKSSVGGLGRTAAETGAQARQGAAGLDAMERSARSVGVAARQAAADVDALGRAQLGGTGAAGAGQGTAGRVAADNAAHAAGIAARNRQQALRAAAAAEAAAAIQTRQNTAALAAYRHQASLATTADLRLAEGQRRLAASFSATRALIATFGLGILAREYVQAADTATLLRARLRLVADSEEDLIGIERELFGVAQDTRSAYEATVTLYTRVARSAEHLGATQSQLMAFTTATNQAIQVGGNTAQEAAAGVIQLGQALASGELRGEELRSVMEQMPRLARAIADGMGVTIGELRTLAEAGQLTAERVFGAVLSQAEKLEAEYALMPRTVGGALQQLRNDLLLATDAADALGGGAEALIGTIDEMREIVRDPEFISGLAAIASFLANGAAFAVRNADAIGTVAGAYVVWRTGILAVTAAQVALNLVMRASPIGLAVTAVGLLVGGVYALRDAYDGTGGAQRDYNRRIDDIVERLRAQRVETRGLAEDTVAAARSIAQSQLTAASAEMIQAQYNLFTQQQRLIDLEAAEAGNEIKSTGLIAMRQAVDELELRLEAIGIERERLERGFDVPVTAGAPAGPLGAAGDDGSDDRRDKLREAREALEFEITLLGRSQREQDVLTALRRAGAEATIAQGESLAGFIARLGEEERAIAQAVILLSEYKWGVDEAAAAEKRRVEIAEEVRAAHEDAAADIADRLLDLGTGYQRAVAQAEAWRTRTLAALDETAQGHDAFAADVDRIYRHMLAEAYEEDLRNRRDWASGVRRALRDYADAATDAASNAERSVTSGLASMEDAVARFVTTGKLGFSDMVDSILADMARPVWRENIAGPLASAAGGFDWGSLFGGSGGGAAPVPPAPMNPAIMHTGGLVGRAGATRAVPPALFAAAPRYHGGGMLAPDERAIIGRVGEGMFTPHQMDNAGALIAALAAIATRGSETSGEITLRVVDAQGNEAPTRRRGGSGGRGPEIEVSIDALVARLARRQGSETNRALADLGARPGLRSTG